MVKRLIFVGVILAAVSIPQIQAESRDCTTPVLIVADGRITQSMFAQSTTNWYGIYAQAGHSYSVEFVPAADNYLGTAHVAFGLLSVFGPNDALAGCRGTSSV